MAHISDNEEKDCLSTLESDIGYYDMPECEDTLPVTGWAIVEAIDELKETRALFKKQWDRDQEAIKLAQEKGICDDMTWPDRGCLVMFLMDELDKAKAAQSAPVDLERVRRAMDGALFLLEYERDKKALATATVEIRELKEALALLPTPSKE